MGLRAVSGRSSGPVGFGEVARLAIWLGVLAGGIEAVVVAWRSSPARFVLAGPEVIWMAPLVNSCVLAVLGLAGVFVARRWPRLFPRTVLVMGLVFVAAFAVAFLFHPRLNKYAGMLLAAGVAVQVARVESHRAAVLGRLVRRTVVPLVLLVVVVGVGMSARDGWRERRAIAALPAPPAGAPNAILIVLDTVRATSLSLYGYERRTSPELERLAQKGVRFEQAWATASWTVPSHASMFTGRYPFETSANWVTPLDATYPTLGEGLQEHGYVTAGFAANLRCCTYKHGLSRGFIHYEDYTRQPGQVLVSTSLGRFVSNSRRLRELIGYYQVAGRKTAARVNRDFLRWLPRRGTRPFFAFLNYYDAHAPYLPPDPYGLRYGKNRPGYWDPEVPKSKRSTSEVQALIDGYDGSINYLDRHLGRLFAELEARGILRNTLVIVTSDHGEALGEHDLFSHGNSLYVPALHVPLVVVFPGRVPSGRVVPANVTLRDLPATIMDLLGLDRGPFPGASLARYWEDGAAVAMPESPLLSEVDRLIRAPQWLPASRGDMKSLVLDHWHYILGGDGREELYDLARDPDEERDRSQDPEARDVLERARLELRRVVQSGGR